VCKLEYAEIDAFGFVILLLFYFNQRRSGTSSLDDRLFNWLLLVGMAVQLLDGALWLLDGVVYPGGYAVLIALTTVDYFLQPFVTCFWAMYCELRVHMDERGLKKRLPLYLVPIAVNLLLVSVNLFYPLIFRIDAGNTYHRESLYFMCLLLHFGYLVGSFLIVIRKMLTCSVFPEHRELAFMLFFAIPPIIGGILQQLFYGSSLVWPSLVISIVIVYINVLNRQISTDSLTGLNNRRGLKRFLDVRIASNETDALFLIIIDADDFKAINDRYGHVAGDRALTQIAEILKTLCADRDCFLARLGGDEFVIVRQNATENAPEAFARRIADDIEAFNLRGTEPYRLSLSIGSAYFDANGTGTTDALLTAADQNMYQSKIMKKASARRALSEAGDTPKCKLACEKDG
jgi:diguanylate cyclase (GGDEF)-like protein